MSDKGRFEVSFDEKPGKKILTIKHYVRCECCDSEKLNFSYWAEFPCGIAMDDLTKELIIANLHGLASMIEKKIGTVLVK